ncbi:MAG: hypothetical protein GF344_05865 [Chitinivibrionales bacterium]|nr:hypothetical protein [Chitinivibrionales bacterium]
MVGHTGIQRAKVFDGSAFGANTTSARGPGHQGHQGYNNDLITYGKNLESGFRNHVHTAFLIFAPHCIRAPKNAPRTTPVIAPTPHPCLPQKGHAVMDMMLEKPALHPMKRSSDETIRDDK